MPKQSKQERKIAKARAALERLGFKEDELKVTFSTDEELLKFYEEIKAENKKGVGSADIVEDDDKSKEPEDTFRLDKKEAETLERQQQIEQAARAEDEKQAKNEEFEAATEPPKHLDEGEKPPTWEDFQRSLREGLDSDDSNVPNN